MRAIVVGASSGLGRCIAAGIGQRGDAVALMARRADRLADAVTEAGDTAFAVTCDVTDETSVREAVAEAADRLGGIDTLVYASGIGGLERIEKVAADTWRATFDTNVVGAALVTAAALPHLKAGGGSVAYLSSISASLTAPWAGLAPYIVSKAALDKLVECWRAEHPQVSFTRVVVGDSAGGTGDSMSGFNAGWDLELATELGPQWFARGYLSGALTEIGELVSTVLHVLDAGPTASIPSVTVIPRLP